MARTPSATARPPARHPHGIGDGAHQDVRVSKLRLEQDPEAIEQRQEPEPRPDLAEIVGLVRAGRQALQIGPVRDDGGREVHVEEHPRKQNSPHTQSWSA